MGTPKTVKRFDTLDAGSWMTTKFTRTTEGFLTGRAIVTSIGVFTYQYADGTVLRELRLPEEVFAPESLESMKLKPVTNQHPDGFRHTGKSERASGRKLGKRCDYNNTDSGL